MPLGHVSRCALGYGYGCACDSCNTSAESNDTASGGQLDQDGSELAMQAATVEAVALLAADALKGKTSMSNNIVDYAFGGAASAFVVSLKSVLSSPKVAAARAACADVSTRARGT